jgi:hypothetical protein
MIERPAEFNAQILAFLTGDTRYLDYVETTSETSEEELEYPEDDSPGLPEEDDAASTRAEFAGASEDATDLAPPPAPATPDDETEGPQELPNVVRKQGDRYPARNREAELGSPDLPSDDGAEDDRRPRSQARRTPSDENFIPELPEDLFDWPEARNEFLPRERPRTGSSDERGNGSDEQESPPPRF